MTNRPNPTEDQMSAAIIAMFEQGTPAPGNICKVPDCGGRVVKEVTGLYRGGFTFSAPQCEKCHTMYHWAMDVPQGGGQEFLKSLSKPMTF